MEEYTVPEWCFNVTFSFNVAAGEDEFQLFGTRLDGEIWADKTNGAYTDPPIKAGHILCFLVDISKMLNKEADIYEEFDDFGEPLDDYCIPLFGTDSEKGMPLELYTEEVCDISGPNRAGGMYYNLLIIDELALKPPFRGKNEGLNILSHVIDKLQSGIGVAALNPIPMQHWIDKSRLVEYELEHLTDDSEIPRYKLWHYFGKLGFKKLADSNIMVLDWEEFEVVRELFHT